LSIGRDVPAPVRGLRRNGAASHMFRWYAAFRRRPKVWRFSARTGAYATSGETVSATLRVFVPVLNARAVPPATVAATPAQRVPASRPPRRDAPRR